MPKKNKIPFKFKLLIDKPLSGYSDNEIKFGHKQIANTLVKLIKGAVPPFTIGLYGSWGSGKSTIMKSVEKKLTNTSFKVVEFDVWKYEGDTLRRQFLLETTKQLLGNKEETDLRKEINYDVEFKEEGPIKVNVKLASLTFFTTLALFLLPVIITFLIIGDLSKWKLILGWVVAAFVGSGGTALILPNYLNGIFKTLATKIVVVQELTLKKDKLSRPEEFQDKFIEIIKNKKNSNKKILFILDNLDRSSHDKATELLTTVKTFLEVEKCIFLIPCDEEAIKKHVAATYISSSTGRQDGGTSYAEEYLRKFFNTIVRIPRFEGLDLDLYTQEKLVETAIPEFKNNSNLTWIITSSFRNNPREIKQFINTLISSVILIKEKIMNKDIIDENILENNAAFLAKILIFKQKYPNAFVDLEKAIMRDGKNWEDLEQKVIQVIDSEPEATNFFFSTKHIAPSQVDASFFFTFNQSRDEHSLPQWNQFKGAALDRDFDLANKIFQSFIKDKTLQTFETVGSSFVKNNKSRLASIKPFISTYLNLYSREENKEKLPNIGNIAIEVSQLLPDLIKETYSEFPIKATLDALKNRVSSTLFKSISSAYVFLLTQYNPETPNLDDKNLDELLTYIAADTENHFAHESSNMKQVLKDKLNKGRFIKLFANSQYKNSFIDSEVLNKFLSTLVSVDINTQGIDVEDLNTINSFELSEAEFNMALNYGKNLIGFITSNPDKKKEVIDFIRLLIRKQPNSGQYFEKDEIRTHANDISSNIINLNSQTTEIEDKKLLTPLALALHNIPNNSQASALSGMIEPNVKESSYSSLYSKLDETEFQEVISKFPEQFLEACLKDEETYTAGKKFLNKEQKENFAIRMIDQSVEKSLNIVQVDLNGKVEDSLSYINTMLGKIDSMTSTAKKQFLDLANSWKFAENEEVAKKLYQVIFAFKEELEIKTRTVYADGLKKYISKEEFKLLLPQKKLETRSQFKNSKTSIK